MSGQSKISLRILFLFAVIACSGIDAYSNFMMSPDGIEHTTGTNNGENMSFSDSYFFDIEQINLFFEFIPAVNPVNQSLFPGNCILLSRYPTPIWQPPKIQ